MLFRSDNTNVDGGLEEQQGMEHDVPNGAREEREACARGEDEEGAARKETGQPASSPVWTGLTTGHAPEKTGLQPGLDRSHDRPSTREIRPSARFRPAS